jgi:hypothetical protein
MGDVIDSEMRWSGAPDSPPQNIADRQCASVNVMPLVAGGSRALEDVRLISHAAITFCPSPEIRWRRKSEMRPTGGNFGRA